MANLVTLTDTARIFIGNNERDIVLKTYVVNYDTANTDLTLYTPTNALNKAQIASLHYQDAAAHDFVFKSGSTIRRKYASIFGINSSLGEGILMYGAIGEAVKINLSAVLTSPMEFSVFESDSLYLALGGG